MAPRVTCALTNPGARPWPARGRRRAERVPASGGREGRRGPPSVLSSGVAFVDCKFSVVVLSPGLGFAGGVCEQELGKQLVTLQAASAPTWLG